MPFPFILHGENDLHLALAMPRDYHEGPTVPIISRLSCTYGTPYLSAESLNHPLPKCDSLGKNTFVSFVVPIVKFHHDHRP